MFSIIAALTIVLIIYNGECNPVYWVNDGNPAFPCNHFGYGNSLYDPETSRCFYAQTQGPCGAEMTFFQDPGVKGFGICDCSDRKFEHLSSHCQIRPSTFYSSHERCYEIYSQGPCKNGEWLVVRQGVPMCESHQCPQNSPGDPNFWFEENGNCWRVGSIGFCPRGLLVSSYDHPQPHCSGTLTQQLRNYISEQMSQDPYIDVNHLILPHQEKCSDLRMKKLKCAFGSRLKFLSVVGKIGNHC